MKDSTSKWAEWAAGLCYNLMAKYWISQSDGLHPTQPSQSQSTLLEVRINCPCGMPDFICWGADCAVIDNRLTSTRKIVLEPPQFMVLTPYPASFFRRSSWFTLSKAFRKSTNTTAVTQPSSMPFLIQSMKYVTAPWVEWFSRRPHLKGDIVAPLYLTDKRL